MKYFQVSLILLLLLFAAPALAVDITIGTIDPGVVLEIGSAYASEGQVFSFLKGEEVFISTKYKRDWYLDVIEVHYDFEMSVHARTYTTHPGGKIFLNSDIPYTPYDIYIFKSDDPTEFVFDFASPSNDEPVKILAFYMMTPNARIERFGYAAHTGSPPHVAEVFYGYVSCDGNLTIATTCTSTAGSVFNNISATNVTFSGCSGGWQDIMVESLFSLKNIELLDTEISWWQLEARGGMILNDWDGYHLNDELPEKDTLDNDEMIWFTARNPKSHWNYPETVIRGTGDNILMTDGEGGDYNFWETFMEGDLDWQNGSGDTEYVHFIGPVTEIDDIFWLYNSEYSGNGLTINFFGNDVKDSSAGVRFDGDHGSAGADFWIPLLTTPYPDGFGFTNGSIISPIAAFKLSNGKMHMQDHYSGAGVELYIAENQDVLLLSGSDELDYVFTDGVTWNAGTGAHWVVEQGPAYTNDVPADDSINIQVHQFTEPYWGYESPFHLVASNDYNGGDDTVSTMYIAHRFKRSNSEQFTKTPMTYLESTGKWSGSVSLTWEGEYYFYLVAVQNDGNFGKVIEYDVEVRYSEYYDDDYWDDDDDDYDDDSQPSDDDTGPSPTFDDDDSDDGDDSDSCGC